MFYNDKETEESEKKFQENLKSIRKFMAEDNGVLDEQIAILVKTLTKMLENPDKSPEDIAALNEIRTQLQPLIQTFQDMQLILHENLVRQTTTFYHEMKKLAAEGNEDAKKVYEELKPAYESQGKRI